MKTLLPLLLLLSLASCDFVSREGRAPSPLQDVPRGGLVAFYPFNGNARDASGSGFHGTSEGAVLAADRFGRSGAAYSFSGDDQILLGNVFNDLELPFTVSAWIKSKELTRARIFATDAEPLIQLPAYYGMSVSTEFASIHGHVLNGGEPRRTSRWTLVTPDLLVNDRWIHVAVVYRGPRRAVVYLNGKNVGGWYTGEGNGLVHNEWPASIGQFFIGSIDDVAIYNRAITPAEVTRLLAARS